MDVIPFDDHTWQAVSSPADRKTLERDIPGHLRLLVRCVPRPSIFVVVHNPAETYARYPVSLVSSQKGCGAMTLLPPAHRVA